MARKPVATTLQKQIFAPAADGAYVAQPASGDSLYLLRELYGPNLPLTILVLISSATFSWAGAKEDVQAAAKKLADSKAYSWTTHVDAGNFSSDAEGQMQKDGLVHLITSFGDNKSEVFKQGDKIAVKTEDGWKSAEELQADNNQPGPGRFILFTIRGFKSPADQAKDGAEKAKELKKEGDAISGPLSEDAAKELLSFRRRGGANAGDGPQISDAKATVKFWLKEGNISKMEVNVSGKMNFNGQDMDINRTTTTEIKNVDSTKIDLPAEAKAKLK